MEILAKDGRERVAKMRQDLKQASRMKTAPEVQGEPPTVVGRVVGTAGSDDTERSSRAKAQRERAEQEEVTIERLHKNLALPPLTGACICSLHAVRSSSLQWPYHYRLPTSKAKLEHEDVANNRCE